MLLDCRNISVGHSKSLGDYLNSEYIFTRFSFSANYRDSRVDTRIQATDLIANTIYEWAKEQKLLMKYPFIDTDRIVVIDFPNNNEKYTIMS